jgi:hypothetical protein
MGTRAREYGRRSASTSCAKPLTDAQCGRADRRTPSGDRDQPRRQGLSTSYTMVTGPRLMQPGQACATQAATFPSESLQRSAAVVQGVVWSLLSAVHCAFDLKMSFRTGRFQHPVMNECICGLSEGHASFLFTHRHSYPRWRSARRSQQAPLKRTQ